MQSQGVTNGRWLGDLSRGFELFKVLVAVNSSVMSMRGEGCNCPGSVQVVEPHS